MRAALSPTAGFLPEITDEQAEQLAAHLDLLLRWNRKVNLTAVTNPEEAVRKHVGESLFLAARIPAGRQPILDLGSGGGFPGIPVAIVRPDSPVTLVERDIRKSVFLREASRLLPNVSVLTRGIEDVAGSFDWLISRAVNLSAIKRGPEFGHAAVLGGESIGAEQGLVGRFTWTRMRLPWDEAGFLWVGDVSRET